MNINRSLLLGAAMLSLSAGASAQSPATGSQLAAQPPAGAIGPSVSAPAGQMVLAAGTEVPMKTIRELSSRTNRQGDRFDLVVSEDVLVDGHIVIPRGARGVGEIAKLVPKGSFGKSGKLETRLLYVAIGNHRIRLDGHAADRGKSGTGATVATAVFAGVASAFVTGTSAVIPIESTMVGYVDRDLSIVLQPAEPVVPMLVPKAAVATPVPAAGSQ